MCGIVGKISKHPTNNPNSLLVIRDTMVHRQPDAEGVWWSADKRVGLAQLRLAILDLSPPGHQPMKESIDMYVHTFDGEIYTVNRLRSC